MDLEEALEQYHRAVEAVLPSAMRSPSSADGEILASKRISGSSSGDLAYIVELERSQ